MPTGTTLPGSDAAYNSNYNFFFQSQINCNQSLTAFLNQLSEILLNKEHNFGK